VQTVDASHGGVVLGVLPIATALVAVVITHERPKPLFWIASIIGAVLVIAFAMEVVKARGFVLFPIVVNKKPVALIYADANDPAVLRFSPEELSMLKTLRNQAVLVVKQKP
jgi:hypothetical protein